MLDSDLEKYYREHSSEFGWGTDVARLDPERVELLNRHIVGNRVLDVACGSGIYTEYLASRGYDAWGVDLVSDFIEKAKETRKGNYIQGEAGNLPFADNEFDSVLLFDIMEHVDDVALLREAKRVASQRILMNVPRKVDKTLEDTGLVFRHYIDKTHLREYTAEDIHRIARECNMTVVHLAEVNAIDPFFVQYSLFTGSKLFKRIVKILTRFLLEKNFYPTGYFAVLAK